MELKINRIAAVYSRSYYKCFVYVEADPLEPIGINDWDDASREEYLNVFGYLAEEYGLYKNKHIVTRGEYDDNAAEIEGQLFTLGEDIELRKRFLSPYNFLIADQKSSINNQSFDLELVSLLDEMLKGNVSIEKLSERIEQLPKNFYY